MSEIYEGRRSLRLIKTAFRQTRLRIKARFLSNRIKEDSERPAQVVSCSLEGRQAQFSMKKAASIIRIQSYSSLAPRYLKQKQLRRSDLARLFRSTMQIFPPFLTFQATGDNKKWRI